MKLSDKKKLLSKTVTIDFYGSRLDYIKELSEISKYSPFIRDHGTRKSRKSFTGTAKCRFVIIT